MIRHLLSVNRFPPNIPINIWFAIVNLVIPRFVPTPMEQAREHLLDSGKPRSNGVYLFRLSFSSEYDRSFLPPL
jgi:hypothetical protein